MSEWKEYKVADLITQKLLSIGDGYRAKNSELEATRDAGLPFARAGNIDGGFDFSDADFFPIEHLAKVGEKISRVGDTVFTSKGTVGRFAFVSDAAQQFVYSPQLCFWRSLDKDIIFPRFLFYWMQGREFLAQVDAVKGQTDMADYVNLADQRQMKITLPDLPEQQAIAEVLGSLDDKIDLLHRQNRTLEALAETLFRQWFVEEASESWGKLKFHQLVKQVKPGTNFQPKRIEEGIPFLNVRNLNNGFLDYADISYISEEEYKRVHKNWIPQENDILISRIGTLGIVAVISKEDLPVAVHYNMIDLKAKQTSYAFLYFLLKSNMFQEMYLSVARQSVQEYVAIEDAENIEISLPINREDFKDKEKPFIELFAKLRSNKTQIRTLTALREVLLPKLMSGEVCVELSNIELAAVKQ
jgi:restriction endonuclease S subunit